MGYHFRCGSLLAVYSDFSVFRYFFNVFLTPPGEAISSINISSIFSPIPALYKSTPKMEASERMVFN